MINNQNLETNHKLSMISCQKNMRFLNVGKNVRISASRVSTKKFVRAKIIKMHKNHELKRKITAKFPQSA